MRPIELSEIDTVIMAVYNGLLLLGADPKATTESMMSLAVRALLLARVPTYPKEAFVEEMGLMYDALLPTVKEVAN